MGLKAHLLPHAKITIALDGESLGDFRVGDPGLASALAEIPRRVLLEAQQGQGDWWSPEGREAARFWWAGVQAAARSALEKGRADAANFLSSIDNAVRVIRAASTVAARLDIEQQESPLKYHHSLPVKRLAMVDMDAGEHPPDSVYFAQTTRKVRRGPTGRPLKNPREEVIPGAGPGVIAWIDYHILPRTAEDGKEDAVYIDYMQSRPDTRGRGNMSFLVDWFYDLFKKAAWVDWGNIHHSAAERLYQKYRTLGDSGKVPRTYGKL